MVYGLVREAVVRRSGDYQNEEIGQDDHQQQTVNQRSTAVRDREIHRHWWDHHHQERDKIKLEFMFREAAPPVYEIMHTNHSP